MTCSAAPAGRPAPRDQIRELRPGQWSVRRECFRYDLDALVCIGLATPGPGQDAQAAHVQLRPHRQPVQPPVILATHQVESPAVQPGDDQRPVLRSAPGPRPPPTARSSGRGSQAARRADPGPAPQGAARRRDRAAGRFARQQLRGESLGRKRPGRHPGRRNPTRTRIHRHARLLIQAIMAHRTDRGDPDDAQAPT